MAALGIFSLLAFLPVQFFPPRVRELFFSPLFLSSWELKPTELISSSLSDQYRKLEMTLKALKEISVFKSAYYIMPLRTVSKCKYVNIHSSSILCNIMSLNTCH